MAKAKKVNFTLIPEHTDAAKRTRSPEYALLGRLVTAHHPHLSGAYILLAWTKWKEDADGRLTLGKCKRAGDLDKELREHDFVILLNQEAWGMLSETQREALVDHELCHAAVALDKEGQPKEDERGRTVYRVRKHSIEEFHEIVRRHGCYKSDLEAFARVVLESKGNLFADDETLPFSKTGTED